MKKCLNPNFSTSEASTKSWFRTRDLIDEYLNILDTNEFRKQNKKWSDYASREYDTEGMLFEEENNVAYPNKPAFKKIDKAKGITYDQRDSIQEAITVAEFETQRARLSHITGLDIQFDRTIGKAAEVSGKQVTVNPDMIFRDTLIHEIGHIMIDAIGGLDNPMVRRGIEQLESTALATRVREKYSDQPEEIIRKEILATAIGQEGAEIFGNRPDRVSKWERWANLFWNRIKQVLGFEKSVAKKLANEIIYGSPNLGTGARTTYDQRSYKTDELQHQIDIIIANLNSEINILETKQPENYEEKVETISKAIQRLENSYKDVAISSYVQIANDTIASLYDQIEMESHSIQELRRIKEDLSPYENITELQSRLDDITWETSDLNQEETRKLIDDTIAKITYIQNKYRRKVKEKMADVYSTAENGRMHQKFRTQFADEFEKNNAESKLLGFKKKRYINGKEVKKGEFQAAKNAYVTEKMDQNREQIEQAEKDYLLDVFYRTPNDIGFIEKFVYDSAIINDEIIQIVSELIDNAESAVRDEYLVLEREMVDAFNEYKEEQGSIPASQAKRWDFVLDDELDMDGKPTGNKIPFFKGEYNASFMLNLRKLNQEIQDAREDITELSSKDITAPSEQVKKDLQKAISRREEAIAKRDAWVSKNTIAKETPSNKWANTQQNLTEKQKKIKNVMQKLIELINDSYPDSGNLTKNDKYLGEITRLPNVPKSTIEKFTDGGAFENTMQSLKELISPKQDDIEYASISQERLNAKEGAVVERTRDNKLHHTIPIYYRGEIDDQSLDVMSALAMDAYMALNYKHKQGIEAEILALKDIALKREVGESNTVFGRGKKEVKNAFSKGGFLGLNIDSDEQISNRFEALKSLIEARMYGVGRKGNETVNKIADTLVQATSLSILPFNIFSAFSNVTMGKATTMIEVFGENIPLDRTDWKVGEIEYMKNIWGTLNDATKPKTDNWVYKLLEKYDALGNFNGPTFRFAEDSRLKQMLSKRFLFALQSGPENWISGSLTIGTLHSMKLQNKDGKYINKQGEVVSDRSKAATMYDYHMLENGEIKYKEIRNAYKTDNFEEPLGTERHARLTKNLIRDTIAQTQGQYDSKAHSMIELHWWGRMFENMRQWMFRGIDRNWRGATYLFEEEIPEEARTRSRQGGADEIGYQTQFLHTGFKSAKELWRFGKSIMTEGEKLEFDIVQKPWKDLTASEKGRIRKAVITYALVGIAYTGTAVIMGLEEDDDDIPDGLILMAYALERAKQELWFYSNPAEFFKVLKSPAASVSVLKDVMSMTGQAMSDITSGEMELYERGEFKGRPKLEKDITDLLPVYSQLNRNVRKSLEFLQSYQLGG